MTYAALFLAYLAGALAVNALFDMCVSIVDWRPSAALSAAAAVAAVLMVAL